MIKILVLIDSSTQFSRRFLSGLIQYANENESWTFYRLPSYYKSLYGGDGIVERIREWNIDAVIAQWEYEELNFLEQLNIPVFLQSYKNRNSRFSKIAGDYKKVGLMAARFFEKRGFVNFAYYGNKDFYWSKARSEGFRQEVNKLGRNYYYFESEMLNDLYWGKSHIELNDWLISLPKPVGLLACDDSFALQVTEMCKVSNIDIPNNISLIGVDNDELICNLSNPTISSIITNDEKGGYLTGKLLHQAIKNNDITPFNVIIEPIRIELRQSTEKYNFTNKYVTQLSEYIDKNITSNLSVDELIEIVPLSRRNLENKFKEATGCSVYQFILDKKVEYIINELLTTDKSLLEIAIEVGFNDVRNAYRIFKNKTGYTPMNYRDKFIQKSDPNQ